MIKTLLVIYRLPMMFIAMALFLPVLWSAAIWAIATNNNKWSDVATMTAYWNIMMLTKLDK